MKVELDKNQTFPIATITLNVNESVIAESTTLVGMDPWIQVETKVRAGQIRPYMQGQAESEAYYLNTYKPAERPGVLMLAPRLLGSIYRYEMQENGDRLLITIDSFLGAEESISIETAWRGATAFQSDSGLQMLRCHGQGQLLLSSFGSIVTKELGARESFTADIAHLVGFTDQVDMRFRRLGGINATLFHGQEILADLHGPGRVYLQTRSQDIFFNWVKRKLGI
jgi:uncharacterized protein (TIGR00266 family)